MPHGRGTHQSGRRGQSRCCLAPGCGHCPEPPAAPGNRWVSAGRKQSGHRGGFAGSRKCIDGNCAGGTRLSSRAAVQAIPLPGGQPVSTLSPDEVLRRWMCCRSSARCDRERNGWPVCISPPMRHRLFCWTTTAKAAGAPCCQTSSTIARSVLPRTFRPGFLLPEGFSARAGSKARLTCIGPRP